MQWLKQIKLSRMWVKFEDDLKLFHAEMVILFDLNQSQARRDISLMLLL